MHIVIAEENRIKTIVIVIVLSVLMLALCACSSESATETTLDMEQAVRELDEYCRGFPVCIRMDSVEHPEQNYIYDFTGDGYDDVITGFMYGSGLVRDVIVVYDVSNHVFYSLGDENFKYTIKSFDNGCLSVEEYAYPDSYSSGTVEFINNELVFVEDN